MTSQIVEEQTDFVEEQIEKIKGDSKKYTHIIVSDDDLRSFASTLIDRERERIIKAIEERYKSYGWDDGNGDHAIAAIQQIQKHL